MTTVYLLMTPDGDDLDVFDTPEEAASVARELVRDDEIYFDMPPVHAYQSSLAANARPSVGLALDHLAMAMQRDRKKLIDYDAASSMTLEEAYERLVDLNVRRKIEKTGRIKEMASSPKDMARKFLGQNYKTGKKAPARLRSKLLRATGFSAAKVLGLSLLPHRQSFDNSFVRTVLRDRRRFGLEEVVDTPLNACARATAECAASCLSFAGHNLTDDYNVANKFGTTQSLVHEPEAFTRMLIESISTHRRSGASRGYAALVRLNVLSDLPWEEMTPQLFDDFADVQFYDYTKVPNRRVPPNYDLTFSFSGTARNVEEMDSEIRKNHRRVAVVFASTKIKELYEIRYGTGAFETTIRTPASATAKKYAAKPGAKLRRLGAQELPGTVKYMRRKPGAKKKTETNAKLPTEFLGLPVIDGDESDLRPLDPEPSIVGLRWKIPALQGVTMEQVKLFVVRVEMVPSGGGHYAAILPKTPRFDGINYQVYHGS